MSLTWPPGAPNPEVYELDLTPFRLPHPTVPDAPIFDCRSCVDLGVAVSMVCDRKGRYHGHPGVLASLFWHQELPHATVRRFRDELVEWGMAEVHRTAAPTYGPVRPLVIYLTNPSAWSAWTRRFAKVRAPIPLELRLRVYERDGWACVGCGHRGKLTLDHIWPFSLGGPDTYENLQTMCQSCNSRKGARV